MKTCALAFITAAALLGSPQGRAVMGDRAHPGAGAAAAGPVVEPLPATPIVAPSVGRIERIDVPGRGAVPGRAVDVWLPPGFPDAAPYAVAVMFDGQMLFDAGITWNRQEWRVDETAGALQAAGRTRPFVVVALPNAGAARHAEYFPQAPFESLPSAVRETLRRDARRGDAPLFAADVYSRDFHAWVVEVALPAVAARVPVSNAPGDRVAIGASMGGLAAVDALLSRPDAWGGFGALSTHWPGIVPGPENPVPPAFFTWLRERLPAPGAHRLYFDHGDATLDAFYPPLQAEADRIAVAKGWSFPDYRSLAFPNADHSEDAWAARLDGVFAFLLPPRDAGGAPAR